VVSEHQITVALQQNKFTEHHFLSLFDGTDVSRQMLNRFTVYPLDELKTAVTTRKAALEAERCSIQQALQERTAALDALATVRASKESLFKEWTSLVDRVDELVPRAAMEFVDRVLRQAVGEAQVFVRDLVKNMGCADVHAKAAEKVLDGVTGLLPAAAVGAPLLCRGDAGWHCPELDVLRQRRTALEAALKSSDRVAVEQDLEELRRTASVLWAQIASLKSLDSDGPALADVHLDDA